MNKFEQHIKQSLNNFEAEYNPADWNDMQNRISKANAGRSGRGLLIAASVVAVAGLVYYFSTSNKENNITPVEPVSKQQVVVVNEAPVRKEENNNAQVSAVAKQDQQVNNSDNSKTTADNKTADNKNKSVAPLNTVQPAVNTAPENKTTIQNQPKKEEIAVQPPVQPVTPAFTADFNSDAAANKVCENVPVHFTAVNNDASCTYKWYFGDETTSSEQNPTHTFADAKAYNVKLHVTSKDKKQQADHINKLTVVAAPSVRLDYTVSDDNNMQIDFKADADKVTDWKWNFGDGKTASVQNPSHIYGKRGTFKVVLTAKNATGCATVEEKEVNLQLDLQATNGFAPDGSNTWMPEVLRNGDYIFKLTIYDKTGKPVFNTSDKNDGWDGKNTVSLDTFTWTAEAKDKKGETSHCTGLITIKR